MIRIALVEDEDIYVKQMQKYLEQYSRENGLKINLKVFGDGEDILEYYTGQYDIILLGGCHGLYSEAGRLFYALPEIEQGCSKARSGGEALYISAYQSRYLQGSSV